mmetsp:Transcript_54434/g.128539  ORF Transcript_54434/g.128539 Transcript_54434/m.128539 type:complete len:228 (-) Transcript_54434:27-710(-)
MSDSYAVVGCPMCHHKTSPENDPGKVFVYSRGDSWNPVAILSASDAQRYSGFGASVSVTEDFIAVGAFKDHPTEAPASGFRNPGSVYVFTRDSGWTTFQKLTAPTLSHNLFYGQSVSIRDSVLSVGAPKASLGNADVYQYIPDPANGVGKWRLFKTWDSSASQDPATLAFQGQAMNSDGSNAIVGDPFYHTATDITGAAFLVPHRLVAVGENAMHQSPSTPFTWRYV